MECLKGEPFAAVSPRPQPSLHVALFKQRRNSGAPRHSHSRSPQLLNCRDLRCDARNGLFRFVRSTKLLVVNREVPSVSPPITRCPRHLARSFQIRDSSAYKLFTNVESVNTKRKSVMNFYNIHAQFTLLKARNATCRKSIPSSYTMDQFFDDGK
jgi:hypothetical protein